MDDMAKRRRRIPTFGNWESCEELPITQYFESARQAGLLRGHSFHKEEADLFRMPPSPVHYHYWKSRTTTATERPMQQLHHQKQQCYMMREQRKQGRVHDVTVTQPPRRPRAPKAVDEDLYKIPPELLHQKPRRRTVLCDFWKRCLRLNCIP